MKIKPILVCLVENIRLNVESCSHKNPECGNSYHENPPNRKLNRFFLTLLKIRCSLNPKAQGVNKASQLRPEPYFREFFKSWAQDQESTLSKTSNLSLYLSFNA